MRKFFPWTDIIVFSALSLIGISCGLIGIFMGQHWSLGAIISLGLCMFGFIFVPIIIVLKKFGYLPDYVTKDGIGVWCCGESNKIPMKENFEKAVDFILEVMSYSHTQLSLKTLQNCVYNICCEWSNKPLNFVSRYGWKVKDTAGLQSGKHIFVVWLGSFSNSALAHEIGHVVRQYVLDKNPDYNHEDTYFWEMIDKINIQMKYTNWNYEV